MASVDAGLALPAEGPRVPPGEAMSTGRAARRRRRRISTRWRTHAGISAMKPEANPAMKKASSSAINGEEVQVRDRGVVDRECEQHEEEDEPQCPDDDAHGLSPGGDA